MNKKMPIINFVQMPWVSWCAKNPTEINMPKGKPKLAYRRKNPEVVPAFTAAKNRKNMGNKI
jgi:hypothetical protein